MKMMRNVAALGIAKKFYDEARKPANQARIKTAVDKVRSRKGGGTPGADRRH